MTLQKAVFAGLVDPGNLVAVREIVSPAAGTDVDAVDTAVFSGPLSNYTIEPVAATPAALASVRVTQTGADVPGQKVSDGIDTLRNIENLRFCDTIDAVTLACIAPVNVPLATPAAPTIAATNSATAGNATAALSFTAPSAPATGPAAITSFEIVATPTSGPVVTKTGISGTATSGTVTGLVNGTTYTLQVRAVNGFGPGPLSAASNPVTPSAPTAVPPGAPTGVTAVRGNASATVSWTAPANNGGSPITGYQVQVRTGTTVVRTDVFAGDTTTSHVIVGLTNGTAYNFRALAVTTAGVSVASTASNTVTPAAVTATAPGAPTGATAVRGNASATVSWTAPANNGGSPITGYQVQIRRVGVVVRTDIFGGDTSTSHVIGGLTNGLAYTFRVLAVNGVGVSAPSAASNAVTPVAPVTVPTAPGILAPTQGPAGGALTAVAHWAAPSSTGGSVITGYRVSALRMAADGVTVVGTPTTVTVGRAARQRSFPLAAGNYRFQVVAVNAVGSSPASARSTLIAPR
jgi:hypothetical protein